ncbi:TRAM domain-containing protein [Gleimia hominis]|uniref:TRAM domain-containing protein n=1 Tax=Gleimia hominis TaxID=595468 RepID=A0ABU3IBK4_9ACTO|nr:TRAM domain-containing protein [Gleimia hominis]MDT3767731.1 TRAM domain-containing protein [Gleimia hominis]
MTLLTNLEILRPAHGGTCITHTPDGRTVFVSDTLPGEVVDAEVTQERSKIAFARAVNIHKASPDRRPHIWPEAHAEQVGGADLGHVTEPAQRQWKSAVITDQLQRIGGPKTLKHIQNILPNGKLAVKAATGDETGLALHRRTRVDFDVTRDKQLAMSREGTNELVPIETMPLADEALLDLGLFTDPKWRERYRISKRVRAVAPNAGGRRVAIGKQVFNAQGRRVQPVATWKVKYHDHETFFDVHVNGFWQAHRAAPHDLVHAVMEATKPQPGEVVLELYSGAGLLSYFLANAVGQYGRFASLEGGKQAVMDARYNLRGMDTPMDLRSGRVDGRSVLRAWSELEQRPDLVVLDPPRTGAGREVTAALASIAPARIVLVSCDPAAGARDIHNLISRGYAVDHFEALDLFPQTHHVEIVTSLRKI